MGYYFCDLLQGGLVAVELLWNFGHSTHWFVMYAVGMGHLFLSVWQCLLSILNWLLCEIYVPVGMSLRTGLWKLVQNFLVSSNPELILSGGQAYILPVILFRGIVVVVFYSWGWSIFLIFLAWDWFGNTTWTDRYILEDAPLSTRSCFVGLSFCNPSIFWFSWCSAMIYYLMVSMGLTSKPLMCTVGVDGLHIKPQAIAYLLCNGCTYSLGEDFWVKSGPWYNLEVMWFRPFMEQKDKGGKY